MSDETLLERLAANNELLWWLFAASIGLLLLTPLAVAWVVARLPNDWLRKRAGRAPLTRPN